MPYTLKPNKLFVKDPNGSGYLPQNVVTDRTTDDMVAEINAAGANQITAIGNKGTQTLETIPDDYTALSDQVDNLKSALKLPYEMAFGDSVLVLPTETITKNGVTFTSTSSGITANGTATVNAIFAIDFTVLKSGNYRLSGCPSGGGSTKFYQSIDALSVKDTGSGVTVELTEQTTYSLWIVIVRGQTVDNITFATSLIFDEINLKSLKTGMSYAPYKAKTPPLFEGGFSSVTGKYYHDNNESWLKNMVRTNVIRIAKGATIKTSGSYQLTINKYADYNIDNFIENITGATTMTEWICPEDGYYTITFKLVDGASLTIEAVKSAWNFEEFYCILDDRIYVHWIGSGNTEETSSAADSGDCTFLVFPDGEGLLIDSANKRNYTSLRKRLAEAGFYHIKNIIISHFHDDHIGGLIQMINSGYIDITGATVYLPDYNATLWAYNNDVMGNATKALYDEAMTIFTNAGCNLVYPDTDFKPYQIGGAVLSFYNCDLEWYETHSTNYNDWSLCNYIFYGNMIINFTGDIGPIAQSHLGGTLYKTNIYKADHHGWLNQTVIPSDYINNVSPDVVVALDGQVHDQYIGTDTAPLIKWCEKYGVPYYRKYTNGEIVMAVSKDSWSFETKVKRTILPTA